MIMVPPPFTMTFLFLLLKKKISFMPENLNFTNTAPKISNRSVLTHTAFPRYHKLA